MNGVQVSFSPLTRSPGSSSCFRGDEANWRNLAIKETRGPQVPTSHCCNMAPRQGWLAKQPSCQGPVSHEMGRPDSAVTHFGTYKHSTTPMAGTNYWASMTTRNPNAGMGAPRGEGHGSDGLGTDNNQTVHTSLAATRVRRPDGPEAPGERRQAEPARVLDEARFASFSRGGH